MATENLLLVFNIPEPEKKDLDGDTGISFEPEEIPAGAAGEPLTFTMIVTVAGIALLASYLLRKHRGESFSETVEVKKPDGTIEKKTIKWKKASSEAGKTDIVKQLVALIKQLMNIN